MLPPNSRFLGPGISRELEIVNWKNWVFPSNSRYHYGGYSIGIPWIGRNLNEYESVNLQNSELRGRELGGNTVVIISFFSLSCSFFHSEVQFFDLSRTQIKNDAAKNGGNLCSFSYWISRLAAFKMRGQNSPLCSLYNCSRKKVLYCYVLLQCICYTILHSTSKRKKSMVVWLCPNPWQKNESCWWL